MQTLSQEGWLKRVMSYFHGNKAAAIPRLWFALTCIWTTSGRKLMHSVSAQLNRVHKLQWLILKVLLRRWTLTCVSPGHGCCRQLRQLKHCSCKNAICLCTDFDLCCEWRSCEEMAPTIYDMLLYKKRLCANLIVTGAWKYCFKIKIKTCWSV